MKISSLYISLVLLAFLGYPAVAGFSAIFGIGSNPLSIGFRAIILIISILLIGKSFGAPKTDLQKLLLLLASFFWIFYFSRLVVSTILDRERLSLPYGDYWIWSVGACFFPFLALALGGRRSIDWTEAGKKFFLFAFVVSTLVSVSAGTSIQSDFDIVDSGRMRLDALNPISLGHLGGTLLLSSIWLFFFAGIKGRFWYFLSIFAGVLAIYLLLGSNSRGPLVATVFCILILIGIARPVWALIIGILIIPLSFLAPLGFEYFQELTGIPVYTRMFTQAIESDVSALGRVDLYRSAFRDFMGSPIFGAGLEGKDVGSYPHNVLIESFLATGLFGGAIFFVLTVLCMVILYRVAKKDVAFLWLALICFQYVMGAQFSGSIYGAVTFWAALGISIMAATYRPSRGICAT